jgi:raffinose/stachyose/melibiose transport system permease protein
MCLLGLAGLFNARTAKRVLRGLGVAAFVWAALRMAADARALEGEANFTPVHLFAGLSVVFIALAIFLPKRKAKWRGVFRFFSYLSPILAGVAYLVWVRKTGDWLLWMSFRLIFILIIANLFKMWPSIFTAVCIHRLRSDRMQYLYRVLFVVPMIIPQMVGLLIWKFFYDPNVGPLNKVLIALNLDKLLIWLDKTFLDLNVFVEPFRPAWLGDPNLIIPALVFWGFPWVGVVGVLIYLAGLQNIGTDVYEAAELDGVGWWGKFWHIELPLIMTQIRLKLILMIIGTFQAYGFQYILLGPEGGPRNKGLTPGLYMFYQAFQEQNYGYACAVGMILFFIILVLTIINQRYVRVKK